MFYWQLMIKYILRFFELFHSMCCFCLHFSDFSLMCYKKTCCSLLLKKITCCAKKEKKNEEVVIEGVCQSDNNIQDLSILSCLNDLTNCFNVDIMMLYISAMDHARNLKFNSFVQLSSINEMCRRGFYFRARVPYLSFGTCKNVNIKQLCSSSMYKRNL